MPSPERVIAYDLLKQRISAFAKVAANMTVDQPLDTALRSLTEIAVKVSDANACAVLIVDPDTDELTLFASAGLPEPYGDALAQSWRDGVQSPSRRALVDQQLTVVHDARAKGLANPKYAHLHPYLRAAKWDDMVIVPLDSRGRSLGVLQYYYRGRVVLDEDERDFMTSLADQAALAVANANLYGQSERAATRLAASEARLTALMALVPGAVYRCSLDSDWTMELISDGIEAISGYPPSDFVANAQRTYASVIHPEDRADVERAVSTATQEGRPFSLEYRITRADGSVGWVLERGELVRSGGRQWLDGVIFDLTARKRTEEELRAGRAQQAASEERGRIARDLHDSVSQALFSMTLHARTAQVALTQAGIDADDPIGRNVAQLHELTQGAMAEMRALIFELRPDGLRQEGLVTALRRQAAALTARGGPAVTVTSESERWDLDACVEEEVYRLVVEALHNVVKHAAADTVAVHLSAALEGPSALVVEVRDDGTGFDPAMPVAGHFGLATMRERATRAGGQLVLETAPGAGTTVRVAVPTLRASETPVS